MLRSLEQTPRHYPCARQRASAWTDRSTHPPKSKLAAGYISEANKEIISSWFAASRGPIRFPALVEMTPQRLSELNLSTGQPVRLVSDRLRVFERGAGS